MPQALELPHVYAFVLSAGVETLLIAADNNVPDGHSGSGADEGEATAQKQGCPPAVGLNDALDHAGFAAGQLCEENEEEADQGGGGSPDVGEDAEHSKGVQQMWRVARDLEALSLRRSGALRAGRSHAELGNEHTILSEPRVSKRVTLVAY